MPPIVSLTQNLTLSGTAWLLPLFSLTDAERVAVDWWASVGPIVAVTLALMLAPLVIRAVYKVVR